MQTSPAASHPQKFVFCAATPSTTAIACDRQDAQRTGFGPVAPVGGQPNTLCDDATSTVVYKK